MNFRLATLNDLKALQQLYVDTIQAVCADEYNAEERTAWASGINNTARWLEVMNTQYILLATMNGEIAGFATLKNGNYIDFFYVHKNHQRKGIAKELLCRIEGKAINHGVKKLSSDISKTARPFFEKHGFIVLKEQHHPRQGVVLVNYKMEKLL
ncbi:MAG: GNAT family N-acetyltransferase [Bacteroidota bacterium]